MTEVFDAPNKEHLLGQFACLIQLEKTLDSRLTKLKEEGFEIPDSTGGCWKGSKAYCSKDEIRTPGRHMTNKFENTGFQFMRDLGVELEKGTVLEVKFLNGMYLCENLDSTEKIQITKDNYRFYLGEGIKEAHRVCICDMCPPVMVRTTHRIMTKSYNKKWVFIKV